MNAFMKAATFAAAVALSSQSCLAAAVESHSPSLAATIAVPATERADFNLKTHVASAASQNPGEGFALTTTRNTKAAIAGRPTEERQRSGLSKGPSTALIVGGAVLAAVAIAALSGGGKYKCKNRTYYFPEYDLTETRCI